MQVFFASYLEEFDNVDVPMLESFPKRTPRVVLGCLGF
jgi:hypothetical protein